MLSAMAGNANRGRIKPPAGLPRTRGGLLAVVFQYLFAGCGQSGTILLKTGQNGEIALIDYRAAEALNVARTSLLLLRRATALLGNSAGGNRYRQQEECQEKFMHRVLSF
jgi:hypothetical protein